VVMVFEDLQWADPGLLDFVGSVLEWSRTHPMLVLTLSRPELADRRPDWGVGQRAFTSVHLEPLSDGAIEELVRGLVPEAPQDAATRIVARAEGVPLYAVETIRMLADRGVLAAREGAYELVQPLEDLEVPETLQALIASRLDALDSQDRALLQNAAVLGKSFTTEALAAVSGQDPGTFELRLHELIRREFLLLEADPRSPERGQYAFTQSLIREVAYGTLSRADRRARHLTVAHHFEATGDEELAGIVAAHYVEALDATSSGPDADALAARARDWLRQASDRAVSLGSPEQALAFTEQALMLTVNGDERRTLLRLAADAARDAVRSEDRERYLREAAGLARSAGDLVDEAQILGRLMDAFFDADNNAAIIELAESMVTRFGAAAEPTIRAEVARATGAIAYLQGDYEEALRSLDEQLTLLESLEDTPRLLETVTNKAITLGLVGRHREASVLMRGEVETVRRGDDLRQLVDSLGSASLVLAGEDPRGAFDALLEAISVARKAGYGTSEIYDLANGIEFAVELGEWTVADGMLARLQEMPSMPASEATAPSIGEALLAAYRGDRESASAAMASVGEWEWGNPMGRAWVHRVRSVVLTHGGDPAGGFDAAMAAIAEQSSGPNSMLGLWSAGRAALWAPEQLPIAAERIRAALDATTTLRGAWVENVRASLEAAMAGLEGRREEAVEGFKSALKVWAAMQLPFDHAMTVGDAVSVLGADALPPGAIDEAKAFLDGIGAAPLLSRLADARVSTPDRPLTPDQPTSTS
jgi:tetratricopeptide (TPR) repeat protein